jgi:hypothetical protein
MKVVINTCYGGFGLSDEAMKKYKTLKGVTADIYHWHIERNDPILIQVVEEMGDAAADSFAELKVVDIPDGIQWEIQDYDGREWISETHRTWS